MEVLLSFARDLSQWNPLSTRGVPYWLDSDPDLFMGFAWLFFIVFPTTHLLASASRLNGHPSLSFPR